MICLKLKVDLPAGVTIQKACKDAIKFATKLGIKIRFEFNGKTVYALPDNNITSLIEAYYDAVKTNQVFVCTFDKSC